MNSIRSLRLPLLLIAAIAFAAPVGADDLGTGEAMPVATMIKTQLIDPTWMVEVEAEALVPSH